MTDKLTRKSIEALEGARKLALRRNHQAVGVPHLLAALLEQTDGLVLQLIRKSGASVDALRAGAERLLDRIPSVSGPGARQEADKYYVTNELQKLLDDAEQTAKRLKDEYVSVEHLFLALYKDRDAAATLTEAGLKQDRFLNALKEGIDLYQCGIAESLVACKAVAEPELACPEACGPLCVATLGVKAILAVAVLEICRVVIKAGCVNCNGLLNRIRNECLTQWCKLCLYIHLILHKEEVCGFSHRRPDQVIIVLRDRIGG